MAHYAFIGEDNIVFRVIVGRDENDLEAGITSWEDYFQSKEADGVRVLRTSYNTYGGAHSQGGTPLRKNYAGRGFRYDDELDAFIPPQPFDSWSLNEETCLWEAPIAYPEDGEEYYWDEESGSWLEVPPAEIS